jgi:endonuclease/exonuclease/phosphatase (EEP) superfamily protein YafD
MWWLTPAGAWFVLFTAVVPYAFLGYLLVLITALLLCWGARGTARRWYLGAAALAAAGTVLHGVLLAPLFLGPHAHGRPDLVVMSLNVKKGGADPASVLTVATRYDADVVVIAELTPAEAARFAAVGLTARFPYEALDAAPDTTGIGVYARFPLTGQARLPVVNGGEVVRVGTSRPFWLVAVHPSQPLTHDAAWAQDWAALDREVPLLTGPVVMAGDFNATLDHRPVRRLLDDGFVDAAQRADAGWAPTYPDRPLGLGWLPAGLGRIAIDHVLFDGSFDAVAVHTVSVAGSDHRAVIAELVTK